VTRTKRSPEGFDPDERAVQRLADFTRERLRVWWRRHVEKAKPPWTRDPILREHRFTNVYRELDPGTVFAIKNILQREDRSPYSRLFNLMVYRMIGKELTYSRFGFLEPSEFRAVQMIKPMQQMRAEGEAPFTEAYMVYPCHLVEGGTGDKVIDAALAVQQLAKEWPDICWKLTTAGGREELHSILAAPYGWGRFLAYQVLVDASYPFCESGSGPDEGGMVIREGAQRLLPSRNDDWVALGPGAERGLKRVFPGGGRGGIQTQVRWVRLYLEDALRGEALPVVLRAIGHPGVGAYAIDMSNTCNLLCEFDKYERYCEQGRAGRGRLFDEKESWKRDQIERGYGRQLDLLGS
jgi:hypothetical protein